jgi:hypothetical protein
MNNYTQVLNTATFHGKIKAYIIEEIHALVEQSIRMDHVLIQEEHPAFLHQSQMVSYKLDKVIETFYTNQHKIARWFQEMELSVQAPHVRGQLPMSHLGFDGFRINRTMIRCDSLKPATLKKILDNAKDYAVRKVIPDKKKFTTGDVLSFYFHEYTRLNMYDLKCECAKKLKEIHSEILERPPLNPIPVDHLDASDYEFMYSEIRRWEDDNAFGIDVGMTNTCSSSYLPPFTAAANPTKRLRVFDDMDGCEVDF